MSENTLDVIESNSNDVKINASIFNLLINSNRTVLDLPMNDFKKIVLNFLRRFTTQEYITTNEGHQPDLSMQVTVRPSFEISEKVQRVHAHILITIIHNSNIRLNVDAMKRRLPEGWAVYPSFQWMSSKALTKVLRYNAKQQLKKTHS